MQDHEVLLLRRFAHTGDAEAFAEITRLYAGMVYGVCLRVTGDAEHARDATQDTFFQLLKSAGKVTDSLGGWLHQVATRRAMDLVRRDSARRQREQTFATNALQDTDTWTDISTLVDEAMNEISPEHRDLLLRHFLQGETTIRLAAAAGVSQPTMSRRVDTALEQLRHQLRAKGIGVSMTVLATMMAGAAQSAPAALLAELGKITLVTPAVCAATATVLGIKTKLAIAVAVALAGTGGYVAYKATRPAESSPPVVASAQLAKTPEIRTAPALAPADFQAIPSATQAPVTPATPTPGPTGTGRVDRLAPPQAFGGGGIQGGWVPYGGGVGPAGQPPRFGGVAMGGTGPSPTTTTPQGALTRFAALLPQGDPARLRDCFYGITESDAFWRLWESPENEKERNLQQALRSLIAPVEVLEMVPMDDMFKVRWQASVRQPFTLVENGVTKTWQRGDRYEFEASLKQMSGEWKIVEF